MIVQDVDFGKGGRKRYQVHIRVIWSYGPNAVRFTDVVLYLQANQYTDDGQLSELIERKMSGRNPRILNIDSPYFKKKSFPILVSVYWPIVSR